MDAIDKPMIDHIAEVIKNVLCASLKSLKYPDVHFRVRKSVKFYGLCFWHESTRFGYYDIYTYDDIAVSGDQRLCDIVSNMYKALEKHVKSDGKNAASYFIDEHPKNDALDAALYFYETTQYFKKEKENNKMAKYVNTTVNTTPKTEAEVNYDNAISEIDQRQAEDYDKIRKEADAARLAAKQKLEIQKLREEKRKIALDYRFFYEELIAAGFSEEEAWKILLNKQPGYMAPTCYTFSDI